MKKITLFFGLLACLCTVFSQSNFDYILDIEASQIPKLKVKDSTNIIFLQSNFSNQKISNYAILEKYKEQNITTIELVYTAYKLSNTFAQRKLNANRLQSLYNIAPQYFHNRVKWKLVEQTACESPADGVNYFHGFVLHYEPLPTEEDMDKEIAFLDELFTNLLQKDSIPITKEEYDSLARIKRDSVIMKFSSRYDRIQGYIYDTLYTSIAKEKKKQSDVKLPDSTIFFILNRNEDWEKMVVVSDVTASMSTYTGQLIVWLEKHIDDKRIRKVVFFNDGNRKPTIMKKIGSTGGVYRSETFNTEMVINTMKTSMKSGTGGDAPENDIEALIKAQTLLNEKDQLVLIADNKSDMRDVDLIHQIQHPVNVIICGNPNAINVQYLELARRTKGSIHTNTTDVVNLHLLKEGEQLRIGDAIYELKDGLFRSVYISL